MPVRLQVILTILLSPAEYAESSDSALVEGAALRLTRILAGCLMESSAELSEVECLNYGDRRRLDLQTLAWPLCIRLLAVAPRRVARALLFFSFCVSEVPAETLPISAEAGSQPLPMDFIGDETPVQSLSGAAFTAVLLSALLNEQLVSGAHHAIAALDLHGVAGLAPSAALDPGEGPGALPRMLVATCMRAVSAIQQAAAYEVIVKLCTQKLYELKVAALSAADGGAVANGSCAQVMPAGCLQERVTACAEVAACAILYRNEHRLDTHCWGAPEPDCGELAPMAPREVRIRIEECIQAFGESVRGLAQLRAMLPML